MAERDFVSRIHPIDGVQHLKSEMHQALRDAQTRVLITMSANEYVIDEQFIDLCLSKLSRGVELHFGFGYNSTSSERMPQWEKKAGQK